ncbi:MAG TPA: matrixin family metalloprotease [Dehalococcoidia bacterium]|nr:matrixin family metalloprotease [Dehalococcoidia bacterium]
MKKRVLFPVIGLLLVAAGVFASADRANAVAYQLDVCCAWNNALGDGQLTYSISGGSDTDRQTVLDAVEEWELAVPGLTLDKVSSGADIAITLKKGGGVIAGVTQRSFDRKSSLVKKVTVSISLKAFGRVNDQATIGEVTRHEFGHVLGLGHADSDLDLMDPTVGGYAFIGSCDVTGVTTANNWYFDGNAGTGPAPPSVFSVTC